jgi:N-acyl amino acid synthase FeeM
MGAVARFPHNRGTDARTARFHAKRKGTPMLSNLHVEVRSFRDSEVDRLEHDVYVRAGYIRPNRQRVVPQNMDFPPHKSLVAISDGVAVGSVRLVVDPAPANGLFSLKCFEAFTMHSWAESALSGVVPSEILQVGTMVIDEQYRGGRVLAALFQKALRLSMAWQVRFAVSTVDRRFFDVARRRYTSMRAMGEAKYYMGSVTVPALLDLDSLREKQSLERQPARLAQAAC